MPARGGRPPRPESPEPFGDSSVHGRLIAALYSIRESPVIEESTHSCKGLSRCLDCMIAVRVAVGIGADRRARTVVAPIRAGRGEESRLVGRRMGWRCSESGRSGLPRTGPDGVAVRAGGETMPPWHGMGHAALTAFRAGRSEAGGGTGGRCFNPEETRLMSVLGRMTLAGVCCLLIGAAGVVIWWPGRRRGRRTPPGVLRDEMSKGAAGGEGRMLHRPRRRISAPACRRSRTPMMNGERAGFSWTHPVRHPGLQHGRLVHGTGRGCARRALA